MSLWKKHACPSLHRWVPFLTREYSSDPFHATRSSNFPFQHHPLSLQFSCTTVSRHPEASWEASPVVGLPRVFSLHGDEKSVAMIICAAIASDAIDNPQLMDGGANICLTGILYLLVDIVSIPPLPILVTTTSGALSLDDCCTKRGLLPLTFQNGSIYYQPCYYCKNATKTIISQEAILASSNILVRWQQEGRKDARPGTIWFFSNSGLYNITLALEKQDGLYYCPIDIFDIDIDPNRHSRPRVSRIAVPDTTPLPTRPLRY